MSRFFSKKYSDLEPYTPGEQPRKQKYIKLNTNESPFMTSPSVVREILASVVKLQLYSDPESRELSKAVADRYNVTYKNVLMTNGSDEALNFAFMAFCDSENPIVFPDITYGFYPVFAQLNHIPYETIPLEDDYTIDYKKYCGIGKNIVIANPNAPTGILLPVEYVEEIVKTNPDNIVIVDEAYVDFADNGSCVELTKKYDNLIVVMTFSKSRSLAGARLGFVIACESLIKDINTIKYSTNPYNVNRMTSAAGIGALKDDDYYMDNCRIIVETREYTTEKLEELGFTVLPSSSNFIFVKSDDFSGAFLYKELRKNGILVRHFTAPRLSDFLRITIGKREDMDTLIDTVKKIRGGK